jgi:hypothetical protein
MKRYAWGLLTGALLIACFMVVTATASPQDDSIQGLPGTVGAVPPG